MFIQQKNKTLFDSKPFISMNLSSFLLTHFSLSLALSIWKLVKNKWQRHFVVDEKSNPINADFNSIFHESFWRGQKWMTLLKITLQSFRYTNVNLLAWTAKIKKNGKKRFVENKRLSIYYLIWHAMQFQKEKARGKNTQTLCHL